MDKWVPVAWHASASGQWYTTEAGQRKSYYGVTGYPTAYIDGVVMHRGAYTNNERMYQWYMGTFNSRRVIASPLTISFINSNYGGGHASVKVKVELDESISSGHVCHFVLWETNLSYSGRNYAYVERAFATKNVTITQKGQWEEFSHDFTLQTGWKLADLGASVFVQDPNGKEIKNGRGTKLVAGTAVSPTSLGRVKALFN
ncbi:MAG: hypothetical protein GTN49_06120 [candidate division Zixibacteria bacterium]|nr:hypothetical protein [candidate division Zixibacteria bacterium]